MMPELPKLPVDMQNEIFSLIPFLIENLGNPKVRSHLSISLDLFQPSVRKSTHKCIGTFVKFSKRLDLVLTMLIKNGLGN